jgi:hypothetical protein
MQKVFSQKIIEILIGDDARIPAKIRSEQNNCFLYYFMRVSERINVPMYYNPFSDQFWVEIRFFAFNKIADKISNLNLWIFTR